MNILLDALGPGYRHKEISQVFLAETTEILTIQDNTLIRNLNKFGSLYEVFSN